MQVLLHCPVLSICFTRWIFSKVSFVPALILNLIHFKLSKIISNLLLSILIPFVAKRDLNQFLFHSLKFHKNQGAMYFSSPISAIDLTPISFASLKVLWLPPLAYEIFFLNLFQNRLYFELHHNKKYILIATRYTHINMK